MLDIMEMINSVDKSKRVYADFIENAIFRVDKTIDNNFLVILVDDKHNPISPVIRGFKDIEPMNEFFKYRFGLSYAGGKMIMNGVLIPPFKDAVIDAWERN